MRIFRTIMSPHTLQSGLVRSEYRATVDCQELKESESNLVPKKIVRTRGRLDVEIVRKADH